ncbi:MAG: chorismate-binding protein [Microscillaceae bacterium]|nr:chorismate-binding protein [Microscillaceae bacterium]
MLQNLLQNPARLATKPEGATQSGWLWHIWQTSQAQDVPLVFWRLPLAQEWHVLLDLRGPRMPQTLDWDDTRPGFLISPFLNPAFQKSYRLQADVHYTSSQPWAAWWENPALPPAFKKTLSPANLAEQKWAHSLAPNFLTATQAQPIYQQLVQKGLDAIAEGQFQKVVLSRRKDLPYPDGFQAVHTFENLMQRYPAAFCYWFYLPGVGSWMGATPETLLHINPEQIFSTVALAGTQPYQPGLPLKEVAWRQKEIEEQALVSRYIINCFKKIRLREFEEEGPKTVVAGNLMHLKTSFRVDMRAANFAELGRVMLELLHPTSAVCGMPKMPALDFILREEGYDRAFYSGFLGPVHIQDESHLFVNLRCMQLHPAHLSLYAGAGITEDSQPEKEWQETEIKCRTMLDALA